MYQLLSVSIKPIRIDLEEFMHKTPNIISAKSRPVWQQVLIVLSIDTLIVLLGAFVLRNPGQISNLYFMSSIVLFIIAAIPIASEIGGSAKIAGRAIKDGEKVNELLRDKQVIYQQNARTTYVYGIAGLITFALSFLTAFFG
jgi:hypothetical protein